MTHTHSVVYNILFLTEFGLKLRTLNMSQSMKVGCVIYLTCLKVWKERVHLSAVNRRSQNSVRNNSRPTHNSITSPDDNHFCTCFWTIKITVKTRTCCRPQILSQYLSVTTYNNLLLIPNLKYNFCFHKMFRLPQRAFLNTWFNIISLRTSAAGRNFAQSLGKQNRLMLTLVQFSRYLQG